MPPQQSNICFFACMHPSHPIYIFRGIVSYILYYILKCFLVLKVIIDYEIAYLFYENNTNALENFNFRTLSWLFPYPFSVFSCSRF